MINRNNRMFEDRYRYIVGFVFLLMAMLAIRLFVVSVVQHDEWSEKALDQNTKAIYTSAPRGNIYDRNGQLLAGNKQVFTVTFNASGLTTEEINDSALKLINILDKNGDKYKDNFAIKIRKKNGKLTYSYTYKEEIKKWLRSQKLDENLSAQKAFYALCRRYGLDTDPKKRFDNLDVLQTKYNLDIPIYVKKMTYTYDKELEMFLGKFGFPQSEIDKGVSAEKCYKQLLDDYKINPELNYKDQRKIFIIRNEIATNGFTRYIPIKISSNVSRKTIAYIEEANIPGVEIASESERYYPNKNTASHVLGYMGAISESEVPYYVDELDYSASDLIGKDGIELAMEEKLHGTPGVKKIRVNSGGEYVETISETEVRKGSDVYLSIDLDLQKTTEKALKDAIAKSEHSRSGAAVAIDVDTGETLAMASYPDFNPNIFAGGISDKAWKSVQPENPRDILAPKPLMNNATNAAVAPGSTFKPVTAITALMCGLDPYRQIRDMGVIRLGDREYACSAWNDYGGTHGYENLEWGIGNSCNYYFYCIATGKDWGTGASLGYSEKITVEKIIQTARKFGLGKPTGIEISERTGTQPSAEYKIEVGKANVKDYLYNNAYKFFPKDVVEDYDRLKKNLAKIADWIEENPDYGELVERIKSETDVKKSQADYVAERVKFDYFNQAQWTTGDNFNVSIGQGDNTYTPLQMANYVATIGNNGRRNDVTLISGIEGEGELPKKKPEKINVDSSDMAEVIKGMKRVCSSGTLAGVFGNFPVEVAGKTGTAENQSIRQPKSEEKYIKEHLGSFNSAAGTAVSWSQVKKMTDKLMEENPEVYYNRDETVDDALIKASGYKINQSMINRFKGSYDFNAWTIAMAPADKPEIAVAVLLLEGGYSSNAAPVAKEMIADYLNVYDEKEVKTYKTDMKGSNKMN